MYLYKECAPSGKSITNRIQPFHPSRIFIEKEDGQVSTSDIASSNSCNASLMGCQPENPWSNRNFSVLNLFGSENFVKCSGDSDAHVNFFSAISGAQGKYFGARATPDRITLIVQ
jgi:hypothetical protein